MSNQKTQSQSQSPYAYRDEDGNEHPVRAVIDCGYNKYVLPAEDALVVLSVLSRAERYTTKYVKDEAGEYNHTHHVWNDPRDLNLSLTLLPEVLYLSARLAGKPTD